PRALSPEGGLGAPGVAERTRIKDALAGGTLPFFDFGGLMVRAEVADGALLYHIYGRQFPLDDRRARGIEDLPPPQAQGGRGGGGAWARSGACGCRGRSAGASGRSPRSAPTSTTCWRAWATRSACCSCTRSTTGGRWPTRAPPTSAGTAATCRACWRATRPW